jgi:hypothetical protein
MPGKRALTSIFLAWTLSTASVAAGLPPWEFGMSREQVTDYKEFGPYKSFSNGDLETFNGFFDGHKQNVQFFFNDNGLRRVGVYIYEGTDLTAATSSWMSCYEILARLYGAIETPLLGVADSAQTSDLHSMASGVRKTVAAGIKVQMAPIQQPEKLFVYSSFWRSETEGVEHFY